jgi:hypothetical protein
MRWVSSRTKASSMAGSAPAFGVRRGCRPACYDGRPAGAGSPSGGSHGARWRPRPAKPGHPLRHPLDGHRGSDLLLCQCRISRSTFSSTVRASRKRLQSMLDHDLHLAIRSSRRRRFVERMHLLGQVRCRQPARTAQRRRSRRNSAWTQEIPRPVRWEELDDSPPPTWRACDAPTASCRRGATGAISPSGGPR